MSSPRTTEAQASAAWLRRFARTTPGIVGLIAVIIAGLCVIAGVVCAAQLNARIAEAQGGSRSIGAVRLRGAEPLRRALGADAAAASAFLSGGNQTPAMRAQYQQALADASAALADATAGAYRSDLPHRGRGDLDATGGLHGPGRGGAGQQCAGIPDRFGVLARSVVVDADQTSSGSQEDLQRPSGRRSRRPARVGSSPMVGLALLALVLGGDRRRIGDHLLPHEPAVQPGTRGGSGGGVARHRLDRRGHPHGGRRHRAQPSRGHRAVRPARRGSHPRRTSPHG